MFYVLRENGEQAGGPFATPEECSRWANEILLPEGSIVTVVAVDLYETVRLNSTVYPTLQRFGMYQTTSQYRVAHWLTKKEITEAEWKASRPNKK